MGKASSLFEGKGNADRVMYSHRRTEGDREIEEVPATTTEYEMDRHRISGNPP